MLCEIDPAASTILRRRFKGVQVRGDIREIRKLPPAEIVCAGFPCNDLSQAGGKLGISGPNSGLISEALRLVGTSARPQWIVLENVPFMLRLQRGAAMTAITAGLEALGYRWAYRVVDTRAFGLPHRRRRVLIVASLEGDPRSVVLADEKPTRAVQGHDGLACGFYWTEGNTGIGWAVDCVPALKTGSQLGIPSPPGVWLADGSIATPNIRDAERLQGFPPNWTQVRGGTSVRDRWRLVGNAVSVPVAAWLGRRLMKPGRFRSESVDEVPVTAPWNTAGFGEGGRRFDVSISEWPKSYSYSHLEEFLRHDATPLSVKASSGFLRRLEASSLKVPGDFMADLREHVEALSA